MNLLYESGLTAAFLGIESGNEEDLQLYNKGTTASDAEETIKLFPALLIALLNVGL